MLRNRFALPMLSAAIIMSVGAATAQAQTALRMAHGYELTNPHHLASLAMAEQVAACSAGALTIDIYPAGQLGNEAAINEQVKFGGVDIIQTGVQWTANTYAPIGISTLPYVFRDRVHAVQYQDSDIARELRAGYNEMTGLHMLAFGYHGAFNVSSRVPITSIEDAKGLRIRSPDTVLSMAFPRAIGAVPVPIAFAELYLGLQQGVAHASMNPLAVTYSNKLYEVQDYVALTEHMMEFIALIVSADAWRRLSEDERACLQTGADLFASMSAELNFGLEETLRKTMTDEGLIQFTEPEKEPLIAATRGVAAELMAQFGWDQETVDRIAAVGR